VSSTALNLAVLIPAKRHSGLEIQAAMRIGDVDPRGEREYVDSISDKAIAIGGGVLGAILHSYPSLTIPAELVLEKLTAKDEARVDPKQLTIEQVQEILLKEKYVCDRSLATVVYLSLVMGKPLLLEGEAGVGKTEIAKVLSKVLGARLIRLQCYEGLDASTALYEWNYPKQMLHIKLEEIERGDKKQVETEIFTQDYLVKRPLLDAIQSEDTIPPVLLIDEIDRADMEFEAFLLEVLSDFQITIPELGTVTAKHRPYVFLTSNRTREIHDALKRRCLYHWIEYPTFDKEYEIITTKFPEVETKMAQQICAFMQKVREMNFYKRPGVAETLDWATALIALNRKQLDDKSVIETMGCVFKYREDLSHLREQVENRQFSLDALLRTSPELVS